MMRIAKEGVGETIVDIVASISRINEARYENATMLANYANIPASLGTPEAILEAIGSVKNEIREITGRNRVYLDGMLDAFEIQARILAGDAISYRDAIRVMQQVELRPVPEEKFGLLAQTIEEELGAFGYPGNVGEKVSAWLRDTRILPEEVTSFADTLLHKAKTRCETDVVKLAETDGIDGVFEARGVYWSGRSRYLGDFRGDLNFNIDRPWSVPVFSNILCHEGYPGHQAFYSHWDDLYRRGMLPLEGAFYTTAGNPANPMFEGSPECGLHFLGWDDPEADTPEVTDEQKKIFLAGRHVQDLQRMLQQQACYLWHVEGASREEVCSFMLKDGIYNEIEAANSFRFFSHPVQMYYYPAYYYGRWLVYGCYEAVPKEKRREFFRLLYDRPHTSMTLTAETEELIGHAFDPLEGV